MGLKMIFFDLDGILVDSEKVFNKCWIEAANQWGYELKFNQSLLLRSLDSKMAKKLVGQWFQDDMAYDKIRETRKVLMDRYISSNPISSKPNVRELLTIINSYGIKYCIVTSSSKARCQYFLKMGEIAEHFDIIISAENVKRGKPYPDIYIYACDAVGLEPGECLAVEDAPNGIVSAKIAGLWTVMIPDLSLSDDTIKQYIDFEYNSLKNVDIERILLEIERQQQSGG